MKLDEQKLQDGIKDGAINIAAIISAITTIVAIWRQIEPIIAPLLQEDDDPQDGPITPV